MQVIMCVIIILPPPTQNRTLEIILTAAFHVLFCFGLIARVRVFCKDWNPKHARTNKLINTDPTLIIVFGPRLDNGISV